MKQFFDYVRSFAFKNLNAVILEVMLTYVLVNVPALHDACVVLLTLIVKYFYDSSTASAKKDETISNALTMAQQLPGAPIDTSVNPVNYTDPAAKK